MRICSVKFVRMTGAWKLFDSCEIKRYLLFFFFFFFIRLMILKFTIFGGYGIPSTRLWCENIRNIENIPGKERKGNLFHNPFFHFISKNIHTGSSGIQGNGSRLLSPLDSFPSCNLKPLVHILKKMKKIKKSTRKNDQQKYFKFGDSERVAHRLLNNLIAQNNSPDRF